MHMWTQQTHRQAACGQHSIPPSTNHWQMEDVLCLHHFSFWLLAKQTNLCHLWTLADQSVDLWLFHNNGSITQLHFNCYQLGRLRHQERWDFSSRTLLKLWLFVQSQSNLLFWLVLIELGFTVHKCKWTKQCVFLLVINVIIVMASEINRTSQHFDSNPATNTSPWWSRSGCFGTCPFNCCGHEHQLNRTGGSTVRGFDYNGPDLGLGKAPLWED